VHAAKSLTVSVEYLATPGQGFVVQYDGTQGAYEQGPTVRSNGSGRWETAVLHLNLAALDEAENGGADLRLGVSNVNAPLYVHSITISKTAG
jgi:hypothetical protein